MICDILYTIGKAFGIIYLLLIILFWVAFAYSDFTGKFDYGDGGLFGNDRDDNGIKNLEINIIIQKEDDASDDAPEIHQKDVKQIESSHG